MRAAILLACGLAATQLGCAHDLAHASAGATGCGPDEMTVSERALSWSTTSWRVQCRGLAFRCAGETAPVCTVEPDANSRADPLLPATAMNGDVP